MRARLAGGAGVAAAWIVVAATQPHRDSWRQAVLAAEDARAPRAEDLDTIRRAAREADDATRAAAVRALGRLERPDLLDDILPFLASPAPRVRAEAANAVGQAVATESGAPVDRARALLVGRLQAEREASVRGVICETLGRLPYGDAETVRLVEAALVDASWSGRVRPAVRPSTSTTARGTPVMGVTVALGGGARDAPLAALTGAVKGLEALVRLRAKLAQPDPATVDRLRRLLHTARPGARAGPPEAARAALSRTREPAAVIEELARVRRLALQALDAVEGADPDTLWVAIGDDDPQVRRLAAQAAGGTTEPASRRSVIARALADPHPMVRVEAVRAYGRALQATAGCGPLVRAAEDSNHHVAMAAIDQLGAAGCPDRSLAVEWLARAVEAVAAAGPRRWHAPAHALVALARLAPERAAPALGAFSAHTLWQVRMYAARAAGVLRDVATLERLASDAHPNVREAALAGLHATVGHGADDVYLSALESGDYQLVRTAARALKDAAPRAEVRTALLRALDRLSAARRDTSRDTRLAVLAALRGLGGAADAPRLEPYLGDFDPRVAAEAAATLSVWTGRPVAPETRRFAPSPAPVWAEVAPLDGARVRVHMLDGGAFDLVLFADEAPATVARFVHLARAGYYDGLTFHRVVANFVIQGGSPGANEYMGDGPYLRDEVGLRPHRRGAVGISTRGRDTGDAQIFVDLVDNPRLDHVYTVFAQVVAGLDVVDDIREGDVIDRVVVLEPEGRDQPGRQPRRRPIAARRALRTTGAGSR